MPLCGHLLLGAQGLPSSSKPVVESAVTRLLVSIKQLLESLTQWSLTKSSEEEVSDVYVRLGNDFNTAVSAFTYYEIDMSYVSYLIATIVVLIFCYQVSS